MASGGPETRGIRVLFLLPVRPAVEERSRNDGTTPTETESPGDRTHWPSDPPVFDPHSPDPDGQLLVQHCGSDLCRPGGGGHGDGRHQRGLSSDHCHHCPGADDRGRLRGEYESLPGPPAARGGGPDRQPYRDPAGGRGGFPGGGGKPVRPADCPAVRGHGDGFSGVSGLYPDHRLGAALPAL